jgi:hypothetical protein
MPPGHKPLPPIERHAERRVPRELLLLEPGAPPPMLKDESTYRLTAVGTYQRRQGSCAPHG